MTSLTQRVQNHLRWIIRLRLIGLRQIIKEWRLQHKDKIKGQGFGESQSQVLESFNSASIAVSPQYSIKADEIEENSIEKPRRTERNV